MSQVCTVCVERCGERGAIRLEGLYPMIDAALCTGCGDCASACPAPGGAIVLIAKRGGV
jgi:heterodisulfide reductase subunit A-like polyferredoxin